MPVTVSKSFTATGAGPAVFYKKGQLIQLDLSGTFVGTVQFERSRNNGASWEAVPGFIKTAAYSGAHIAGDDSLFRWNCTAYTSGTAVATIYDQPVNVQTHVLPCAIVAKVGATAGFVVGAANNKALTTCPASQTAATLVVPVRGLKTGDTIVGFSVDGTINSAGGTVTLDVELRKLTAAAAAAPTDASVASMTQISVVAQTALNRAAFKKVGLGEVVVDGDTHYFLVTATTAGSTDISLQGINLDIVPG